MQESNRADRIARLVVAGLCCAAVFYLNFRFVLTHFAHGSDLLDTGWFAWIMSSGDPWLTNPHSVSDLSYFNYHLTPYLSAVSVALHAIGSDRFMAFALHEGAVFALLAGSFYGLVLTSWSGARSVVLFVGLVVLTVLEDVILQIAAFPHPEIAIVGFCLLGAVFWQNGRRGWAALSFVLACLVREDGGLYAAAFLFGLALLPPLSARTARSREVLLGAATAVISLLMFWLKARYFPDFQLFRTTIRATTGIT